MREQVIAELGRVPVYEHEYSGVDDFGAYHAAEEWLKGAGFSAGRMQAHSPTGIKRGEFDVQKWRNLDARDRRTLDGVIVGDFRNGPVTVLLMVQP